MPGTCAGDVDRYRNPDGTGGRPADRREQRHRDRPAAQRVRSGDRRKSLESGRAQRRAVFHQDHQGQRRQLVCHARRIRVRLRRPDRFHAIRRRTRQRHRPRDGPYRTAPPADRQRESASPQHFVRHRFAVLAADLQLRRTRRSRHHGQDLAFRRTASRSLRPAADVARGLRSARDDDDDAAPHGARERQERSRYEISRRPSRARRARRASRRLSRTGSQARNAGARTRAGIQRRRTRALRLRVDASGEDSQRRSDQRRSAARTRASRSSRSASPARANRRWRKPRKTARPKRARRPIKRSWHCANSKRSA